MPRLSFSLDSYSCLPAKVGSAPRSSMCRVRERTTWTPSVKGTWLLAVAVILVMVAGYAAPRAAVGQPQPDGSETASSNGSGSTDENGAPPSGVDTAERHDAGQPSGDAVAEYEQHDADETERIREEVGRMFAPLEEWIAEQDGLTPTLVSRVDFHFTEAGAPIDPLYVRPYLERLNLAFAESETLVFDEQESWRAHNRPAHRLRDDLPRTIRYALSGDAHIDVRPVGRLALVQGHYSLQLRDLASGFVIHEFVLDEEEALTASGRLRHEALERVLAAMVDAVAPVALEQLEQYVADAPNPWIEPEVPSAEDVERFYQRGLQTGRRSGFDEGYDVGISETHDAMRVVERDVRTTGLLLDFQIGGEVLLGHSRSDVLPQVPDDRFKYVTRAYGAPTLSLALQFDLAKVFSLPSDGVFVGFEGAYGFGEYIRFWQAGVIVTQRVQFAPFHLDLSVGFGALQLSSGSDDISDVAYFILTDQHGLDEETAFNEAFNHRLQSEILPYVSLRPRLGLRVNETIDVFAQVNVLFAPASHRFTLAGRSWGSEDEPSIPGFDWGTIGVTLLLGTTVRF